MPAVCSKFHLIPDGGTDEAGMPMRAHFCATTTTGGRGVGGGRHSGCQLGPAAEDAESQE